MTGNRMTIDLLMNNYVPNCIATIWLLLRRTLVRLGILIIILEVFLMSQQFSFQKSNCTT